jgi:hypothetical protein
MSDHDERWVDATPAKRFFVSMLIRDIELMPAIIDLVDNSADGAKRMREKAGDQRYAGLWVKVTVAADRFGVEDNCGGIEVDLARHYAFRFGRAEDVAGPVGEVGQFGIGMKRALFKMGERFTIDSAAGTSRFSLSVDVGKWLGEQTTDWAFEFTQVEEGMEVPVEKRGTNIVVDRLHELVRDDFGEERFVNRLRRQIAMRELRLLQQGLAITVNDEPLVAPQPILLAGDGLAPIHVENKIVTDDAPLTMQLWAGLAQASKEEDDDVDDAEKYRGEPPAGWYLFCNDRLLLYADKTRLTGWGAEAAAYHPQYARFRGYVLLEGDARFMPWTTTKTGVDEDSRVFRSVQTEMFDALQKVQAAINRLKAERRRDPSAQPAVQALERAKPVALSEVAPSTSFQLPEPAPDPPPSAQWIRYQVDLEDFERVAEVVGSEAPAEVGRATFDWFLEEQVD